jgi:hypothetical protein
MIAGYLTACPALAFAGFVQLDRSSSLTGLDWIPSGGSCCIPADKRLANYSRFYAKTRKRETTICKFVVSSVDGSFNEMNEGDKFFSSLPAPVCSTQWYLCYPARMVSQERRPEPHQLHPPTLGA